MDLWGAGCVLYEIITKAPLFPGSNELDQLHRIHGIMGTPSPKLLKKMLGSKGLTSEYNFTPKEGTGLKALLPNVSSECLDLLQSLLIYDPDFRITARDALKHAFFKEFYEAAEKQRTSLSIREQVQKTVQIEKEIPHPSYLKKTDEEKPRVEEVVPEKRKSLNIHEKENDVSDTHSIVSTNSTSNHSNHNFSKKQAYEERYPMGIGNNRLRRTKQKEYAYKTTSQTKVFLVNLACRH
jgi:serine/threonine protein kinase